MNRPAAPIRSSLLLGLALVFSTPPHLHAQERLPAETIQSESITPTLEQQIRVYLNGLAPQLAEPDADLRKRTRRELVGPLNRPDATEAFQTTYSLIAAEALEPLLESDDFATRLNAIIAVSELYTVQALDLASEALDDANPAVRYWAARCYQDVGNRIEISTADVQRYINALATALATETNDPTAIRIIDALGAYNDPEAISRLINALINREDDSLSADERALTACFQWLIRSRAEGLDIESLLAETTALAIAKSRIAISQLIQDPETPNAAELIRITDQILGLTRNTFFPNTPTPDSLAGNLARSNWATLNQDLDTWAALMIEPAIGLSDSARDALTP
ncbi:HEAT repeat domain-containing protein [Mucisphaera sp.]|uniref:HEAT repeat domain-containing protein n=1 Tax=Mucisphaera sp. TaxID=2913024 RepID=UPI003D0AB7AA